MAAVLPSKFMILRILILWLVGLLICQGLPQPLSPSQVVVVYNSSIAESKELAEFYALTRKIPVENLVGLEVTEKATIDRATYVKTIRNPLREKFNTANWWTMGKDQNGLALPSQSKIRCLALMKGVPLRIKRGEVPESESDSKEKFVKNNEAAIDSELNFLGVETYPIGGPIPNPYFQKDAPFAEIGRPYQLLVGRIDASSYDHCRRMILDAQDTEKDGLWGRTYLDFSRKGGGFAVGDKWIEKIKEVSFQKGFPTVLERNSHTYTTNYPMTDAAVYFGWYTWHLNGPFLNPKMRFKRGAIAVHLHSFSAQQLINPAKNWSAGLIDKGAAATLGNTWEPYLQASHQFDIFFDRLLKGYSLIEAGSMCMNVVSWQNIVIGDPLYRPFLRSVDADTDFKEDRDFKAYRLAYDRWPDEQKRNEELLKAAARMKSGTIFEALALQVMEAKNYETAAKSFTKAKELYKNKADKLRQDLHLVEIERRQKKTKRALTLLRRAQKAYKDIPEVKSVEALITILDPPPPPPTKNKKKK